ncbi:hypothetical protein GCM10022222_17520 [Amycolatopsis ultiminotia]|uniref:Excreted virulence factor EspC, type VII ESX diderm n=1 Tax=Amycolatopsis ultiminotia TaxID=543629 RepID=A0ABP6VIL0_9PSEU
MGFTTVPDALRAAGRSGDSAVGAVRGADCDQALEGVPGALPGSNAAGAARTHADTWGATLKAWCADVEAQAKALSTAADAYVAGDEHAREPLPDGHKMTGPR